jgi:anti-sigma B factor antagonist
MATLLTRSEGDVLIAYFQDVRIIDESRIESLGNELVNLLNEKANDRIILNFKNVGFMSSAMIGKLISFGKKCKEKNVALRITDITENVAEVFKLMRLEKVFEIDPDEETALEKLNKKGWFS